MVDRGQLTFSAVSLKFICLSWIVVNFENWIFSSSNKVCGRVVYPFLDLSIIIRWFQLVLCELLWNLFMKFVSESECSYVFIINLWSAIVLGLYKDWISGLVYSRELYHYLHLLNAIIAYVYWMQFIEYFYWCFDFHLIAFWLVFMLDFISHLAPLVMIFNYSRCLPLLT